MSKNLSVALEVPLSVDCLKKNMVVKLTKTLEMKISSFKAMAIISEKAEGSNTKISDIVYYKTINNRSRNQSGFFIKMSRNEPPHGKTNNLHRRKQRRS